MNARTWAWTWCCRCSPLARRVCLIVANLLMIYATWLILLGSIEQTTLNMGASAPASGLSQAWFFGVGVVFAASTGLILLYQLYQLFTVPAADLHKLISPRVGEPNNDAGNLCLRAAGGLAIGLPVAYALILTGVALMYQLDFYDAQIVAQNLLNGADSFPLMAVPFFMLAGAVMNAGGLSARIVDLALKLVGHIKGGLGYVTILAACILASLSGSAAADAAALSASAGAHDDESRAQPRALQRAGGLVRHHRAGHPLPSAWC